MSAATQTASEWLTRAVKAEKDELLQKLSSAPPPQRGDVLLDLEACDRLLARIERCARAKAEEART